MSTLLRVVDAPVARTTDPITSYLAGEHAAAREASEREVIAILSGDNGRDATDYTIYLTHRTRSAIRGIPAFTEQRLRTARAQLVRKGLVESAGSHPGASPTGRAAMAWKLVTR